MHACGHSPRTANRGSQTGGHLGAISMSRSGPRNDRWHQFCAHIVLPYHVAMIPPGNCRFAPAPRGAPYFASRHSTILRFENEGIRGSTGSMGGRMVSNMIGRRAVVVGAGMAGLLAARALAAAGAAPGGISLSTSSVSSSSPFLASPSVCRRPCGRGWRPPQ